MTIHPLQRQRGFTLTECMIALTLGALVTVAAIALLLSAQQTYRAIDNRAQADDSGAYAMAMIGDAIRQAGYADYGGMTPPPPATTLANSLLTGMAPGPTRRGDTLSTRFMATDAAGATDPRMRNCAGMLLPPQTSPLVAEAVYQSSGFYQNTRKGESQLFCQYKTRKGEFTSDAIARGVTGMQLSYGIDMNRDGLPETFRSAQAIPDADWNKVVAVIVTLSMQAAPAWQSIILLRNPRGRT